MHPDQDEEVALLQLLSRHAGCVQAKGSASGKNVSAHSAPVTTLRCCFLPPTAQHHDDMNRTRGRLSRDCIGRSQPESTIQTSGKLSQ